MSVLNIEQKIRLVENHLNNDPVPLYKYYRDDDTWLLASIPKIDSTYFQGIHCKTGRTSISRNFLLADMTSADPERWFESPLQQDSNFIGYFPVSIYRRVMFGVGRLLDDPQEIRVVCSQMSIDLN